MYLVKKDPHISGPAQFKPVLFKDQLYWGHEKDPKKLTQSRDLPSPL